MEYFIRFLSATIVLFIISLPVMVLWNWLIPDLFGISNINYWQSMGLCLLAGFLFKGDLYSTKE